MTLQEYINRIIEKPYLWKYYDNEYIRTPDLNDSESCKSFINEYTLAAKKSSDFVNNALNYLDVKNPSRLKHIVDTYFLGLALFNDKRLYFGKAIQDLLRRYKAFSDSNDNEINKEFQFVWFMITLYHDLGYVFEKGKVASKEILNHKIPHARNQRCIPQEYVSLFKDYEQIEHPNDHGICGGLEFDRDICETREIMSHFDISLSWRKELEEVYHDVAWIIIAHNIWWNRLNDNRTKIEGHLKGLKLPSQKYNDGSYKHYPIDRCRFPLFTLFCLVDTIEPLKRHIHMDKINIDIFRGHIYLQVYKRRVKSKYVGGIIEANKWLMPISLLFDSIIDIECPKIYKQGCAGIGYFSVAGKKSNWEEYD